MLECKHRGTEERPQWWKCGSDRIFVKRNGLMHESTCLGECPHANQENISSGIQIALPQRSGPGTELSILLAAWQVPSCQACHALSLQMDRWGPQGCRDNRDFILKEMEARAKQLGWFTWLAAKVSLPFLLDEAINRVEAKG